MSGSINTPTIISAIPNSIVGITIKSTGYVCTGQADSYQGTNYRICKSDNVDDVLYEGTYRGVENYVEHSLTSNTTYYVFIRHTGDVFGASDWSESKPLVTPLVTVKQPSITSPSVDDNINVFNGVTLISSAFRVNNGTDTHKHTEWKITTDNEGDNIVASTSSATDLTTHTFAASNFRGIADGQILYVRVRHAGNKLGNSLWSYAVAFKVNRSAIDKPSIISPAPNTDLNVYTDVSIVSSEFSYMGYNEETYQDSDWKITRDPEGNDIAIQALGSSSKTARNFISTFFKDTTVHGQTLYLWVRHRGSTMGVSPWSDPVPVRAIKGSNNKPTITAPTANQSLRIARGITVTADAYSYNGFADTHKTSDWKITSDAAGNNILAQALKTSDLTSHTFPYAVFKNLTTNNQTFYLWVRYTGSDYGTTVWSDPMPFIPEY